MGCPGLLYTRLSIYTAPELCVRHLTDLVFRCRYLSSPLLKLCLKLHIKMPLAGLVLSHLHLRSFAVHVTYRSDI